MQVQCEKLYIGGIFFRESMNSAFILSFLSDLRRNNNRNWFEKNKYRYKEALGYFTEVVHEIIKELGRTEPEISLLEPKDCIFRIYRDIRFSKDKTPYKLYFGAYFSAGGKSGAQAGYYLHFEPEDESFLGGGLYHPAAEKLAKVRQEIDYNASELASIVKRENFKRIFGEIQGESLVRPPKGYSEDHPQIELLKLKDFFVIHKLSDKSIKEKNFVRNAVSKYKTMKPFNDFLNVAIS